MRLIDADVLLRSVPGYDPVKYTYEYGDVVTVQDVKSIPTIDAVPVVRCKDCTYYDWTWWDKLEKNNNHYCPIIDCVTDVNFFCAKGERK